MEGASRKQKQKWSWSRSFKNDDQVYFLSCYVWIFGALESERTAQRKDDPGTNFEIGWYGDKVHERIYYFEDGA